MVVLAISQWKIVILFLGLIFLFIALLLFLIILLWTLEIEEVAIQPILAMLLVYYGISFWVMNRYPSKLLGFRIPLHSSTLQSDDELFDLDDSDDLEELVVLGEPTEAVFDKSEWKCANCNEPNPGELNLCWNCGCSYVKDPQV